MRWSDIPFRPPTTTLRWFAAFALLFLAGLAGWQFLVRDGRLLPGGLLALAVLAGLLGWLFPVALRPVFVGWMVLVFPVGWLTSHLVLGFLFYCIFTPVGLFFKLVGRDALCRRFPGQQDTYWTDKPAAEDVRRYFRQS
jgi:hypothetical protein